MRHRKVFCNCTDRTDNYMYLQKPVLEQIASSKDKWDIEKFSLLSLQLIIDYDVSQDILPQTFWFLVPRWFMTRGGFGQTFGKVPPLTLYWPKLLSLYHAGLNWLFAASWFKVATLPRDALLSDQWPDVTSQWNTKQDRRVNGRNVAVLAPVSGAHFNWIVLISQPLTVLIIQMVRVVDVDYITLNPHACSCSCFLSLPPRQK